MKKGFCIFLSIIFYLTSFCQENNIVKCGTSIFISGARNSLVNVEQNWKYSNYFVDSAFGGVNDSLKITIELIDCFGSATAKVYSKNGSLIGQGQFCGKDSLARLNHNIYDTDGNLVGTKEITWYQPIKCGLWTHFNSKGIKIKEEYF